MITRTDGRAVSLPETSLRKGRWIYDLSRAGCRGQRNVLPGRYDL